MIDPSREQLAPLSKAARLWVPSLRGDRPANPSTIWRWIRRGVRGVHLEFVQAGGQVMVSRQAIERFFARLTRENASPPPRTPSLEKEHAKAKAKLVELGI